MWPSHQVWEDGAIILTFINAFGIYYRGRIISNTTRTHFTSLNAVLSVGANCKLGTIFAVEHIYRFEGDIKVVMPPPGNHV